MDFTSALYLGAHSFTVPAGLPLTTGKPAALWEPPWQREVAHEVARRQSLETGLLAPSTLHLFQDVLALLPRAAVVFIDEAMYPVGQWGAAQARLRGVPVVPFQVDDLAGLAQQLHRQRQQGRTPWLLTDGWNLRTGQPNPLARYLALLAPQPESVLLLDDTQAFGVLGARPDAALPLGYGGGGCLPYLGVKSARVLAVTSLAKGFGTPVAVLAGPAALVARYERLSEVRTHTSPVSNWHAWVARSALRYDARHGNNARRHLWQRVAQFRQELGAAGIRPLGGIFPVQKLALPRASAALGAQEQLRRQGIRALLLADVRRPTVPHLAFCLRADHTPADISGLTDCLRHLAARTDWFSLTSQPVLRHEHDAES